MIVSIIIVNHNTKNLLVSCIESIYLQSNNLQFEIIVIDNASDDGSREFLKIHYTNVQVVESEVNLGFGLANNLGAKLAKGKFLFFLNSDTLLIENSVKIMIDFFQKNENDLNIGALGAVLIDEHSDLNGFGSHFPSCKEENKNNLKKIPLLKYLISVSIKHTYDVSKEYFGIDYIIGADLLMKKSLFEKLGGFSNEFFMYYEESDLQKRMDKLGFSRYVVTNTRIIHFEDGSGKVIKKYTNRKRTIVHMSKNIYLKRNDKENYSKYVLVDFIMLVLNFLNIKYSFRENLSYFREVIKTY